MMTADQIIYEDNHLIVLNKQAGQLVQGDKTGDPCLVEDIKYYLKERYNKPGNVFCGVVHRLDRPVSGVVVFAKTSKALVRLNEMIKQREIRKTYWAVSKSRPDADEGLLNDWLIRNEERNKSYVTKDHTWPGAKEAELAYKVLGRSTGGYYLIEVDLHTGRHHQIRCQLAHAGCPIKGDLKYGAERSNPDGSISLHARRVAFVHPVKKTDVIFEAPAPWNIEFEPINNN